MIYRVIVQPRAERDIWAAVQWIQDQSHSPAKALRWAQGLRAKVALLRSNPKRCPVDADSDAYGKEVRKLLYGKRHGRYRILFTIRDDTVYVLTVRHSARPSLSEELCLNDADEGTDALH